MSSPKSSVTVSANDGWEGYLEHGERIIWKGRPAGIIILPKYLKWWFLAAILVWATFIIVNSIGNLDFLVEMSRFSSTLDQLYTQILESNYQNIPIQAYVFHWLGVAAAILALVFLMWLYLWFHAWRLRHTNYALSNKRAFVARTRLFLKPTVNDYPPSPVRIEQHHGTGLYSVVVHEYIRGSGKTLAKITIRFEQIKDGPKVFAMVREILIRSVEVHPPTT